MSARSVAPGSMHTHSACLGYDTGGAKRMEHLSVVISVRSISVVHLRAAATPQA